MIVSALSPRVWNRSPVPPIPIPCSVVSILKCIVLCAFHAAAPPVAVTASARIASGGRNATGAAGGRWR